MIKLTILILLITITLIFNNELSRLVESPLAIQQIIQNSDWLGLLIFIVIFAGTQPLGVPGFVYVLAASLIWPTTIAFFISWIAGTIASVVGFQLARWLGKDFIDKRFPKRFHRIKNKISGNNIKDVVILFLIFYLAPPLSWYLGLTSIHLRTFITGAMIGLIPATLLLILSGPEIVTFAAKFPSWTILIVICILMGILIGKKFVNRNA